MAMANPFCKIRDLFPSDISFPPVEELNDEQLEALMDRIATTLAEKQIYFDLRPGVPERDIYRHFVEDVLEYDVLFENPPEGFSSILDGCDGYCPGCFQRPYCETGKEWDLEEEEE